MPATAPRKLKLPVKVHVLTGSLGSGKTSLITKLISLKQTQSSISNEVWAVLVNEWGEAGIDQAMMQGSGPSISEVTVRQLAGGCLCCALGTVTQVAIVQLLRSTKPDRLFIEPSGLAHPKALLQLLQGEHLITSLAIQPVVCLIDIFRLQATLELAAEQASIADILIGTKADLANEDEVAAFSTWAAALDPPKPTLVKTTPDISLEDVGLLTQQGPPLQRSGIQHIRPIQGEGNTQQPFFSTTVQRAEMSQQGAASMDSCQEVMSGKPRRKANTTDNRVLSCGWIFSSGDIFQEAALLDFVLVCCTCAPVLRLKGVLRTGDNQWLALSGTSTGVDTWPVQGQSDSRIEILIERNKSISDNGGSSTELKDIIQRAIQSASGTTNWDQLEEQILHCLNEK